MSRRYIFCLISHDAFIAFVAEVLPGSFSFYSSLVRTYSYGRFDIMISNGEFFVTLGRYMNEDKKPAANCRSSVDVMLPLFCQP